MTTPDRFVLDKAATKLGAIMDQHFKSMPKLQLRTLLYRAIKNKDVAVMKERQRVVAKVVQVVKQQHNKRTVDPQWSGPRYFGYAQACDDLLTAMARLKT